MLEIEKLQKSLQDNSLRTQISCQTQLWSRNISNSVLSLKYILVFTDSFTYGYILSGTQPSCDVWVDNIQPTGPSGTCRVVSDVFCRPLILSRLYLSALIIPNQASRNIRKCSLTAMSSHHGIRTIHPVSTSPASYLRRLHVQDGREHARTGKRPR